MLQTRMSARGYILRVKREFRPRHDADPESVKADLRREAVMGHSKEDRPGLGLTLALVFVLVFSVYASVASAQPMGAYAGIPGAQTAMQDR